MTPSIAVNDSARRSGRRPVGARGMAALRFASGTVTAGLAVLAAVVGGSAVLAGDRPGPGTGAVLGHAAVAAAALVLQVAADRRGRLFAVLAAVLIFVLAAGTLWFWWWN